MMNKERIKLYLNYWFNKSFQDEVDFIKMIRKIEKQAKQEKEIEMKKALLHLIETGHIKDVEDMKAVLEENKGDE